MSIVTCTENNSGKDKSTGVCIILSDRFVVKQGNRDNIGTRLYVGSEYTVRSSSNLLIIRVYLSPEHSRTSCIELFRDLRRLLKELVVIMIFDDYDNVCHRSIFDRETDRFWESVHQTM